MNTYEKSDILVLGATGYTGRLIVRYLVNHPQRHKFALAIGARSTSKLNKLINELNLPKSVRTVHLDVGDYEELEKAVKTTWVVINAIGPFYRSGTPIVRACVQNGVHYVDLTGETVWFREIIHKFDYAATKTGSIIVPSCGLDSVPSDIAVYLSNITLKSFTPNGEVATSTTAHKVRGAVFSGGFFATTLGLIDEVPLKEFPVKDYCLSPVAGRVPPGPKLVYSLPIPNEKTMFGSYFLYAPVNKALVQRTFGLLEYQAMLDLSGELSKSDDSRRRAQRERYGSSFIYDEFLVMPGRISAIGFSAVFIIVFSILLLFKPIRLLLSKILPKPGEGASDERLESGSLLTTNITTSTSTPPIYVKSIIKGKGEPNYLLTAIIASECALSLVLAPRSESDSPSKNNPITGLSALARQGGVLTPMSAFGDILIERLQQTTHFEIGSWVLECTETKKRL